MLVVADNSSGSKVSVPTASKLPGQGFDYAAGHGNLDVADSFVWQQE